MSITPFIALRKQSNTEALDFSQQAAHYLWNSRPSIIPIPIPFVSYAESTESWTVYEKLMLSCLRTGDDKAAHQCLERLIDRFGATNERIMGLRGLYQEAAAEDQSALERILKEYNDVLAEDPGNTVCYPTRLPFCMIRAELYLC